MAEVSKSKKPVKRKQSSLKRTRQSKKRALHNEGLQSKMRNQIKRLRQALAAKNKPEAQKLLIPTLSFISKMVHKGILHRNAAARYQSRLQRQLNAL